MTLNGADSRHLLEVKRLRLESFTLALRVPSRRPRACRAFRRVPYPIGCPTPASGHSL